MIINCIQAINFWHIKIEREMTEGSPEKEGGLIFLMGKFEACEDIRQTGMIDYSLSEILF